MFRLGKQVKTPWSVKLSQVRTLSSFTTTPTTTTTTTTTFNVAQMAMIRGINRRTFVNDSLKELRNISGAPLKECKKALEATNNNVEKAIDWLRIQGTEVAKKKSSQTAMNGFIASVTNDMNNIGSLAEINCVTDFVEKNPKFQNAVQDIAHTIVYSTEIKPNTTLEELNSMHVMPFFQQDAPKYDSSQNSNQTVREALTDIISAIRENLVFRRFCRMEASTNGLVSTYLHSRTTPYLGMKGAIVHLETDTTVRSLKREHYNELLTLGKNIAIHCAVNIPTPKYISLENITEAELDRERHVLLDQVTKEKQSESFDKIQSIVEKRMKKFYSDMALLEQEYCLEDDHKKKLTVKQLIQMYNKQLKLDITIKNFKVFKLGELSN